MSLFDHPAHRKGVDMHTHICFKPPINASVFNIHEKPKLGWKCSACGKEWVICDDPHKIRQFINPDFGIFTKAMSRAVVITDEMCDWTMDEMKKIAAAMIQPMRCPGKDYITPKGTAGIWAEERA